MVEVRVLVVTCRQTKVAEAGHLHQRRREHQEPRFQFFEGPAARLSLESPTINYPTLFAVSCHVHSGWSMG
jgi:hypothetical protein